MAHFGSFLGKMKLNLVILPGIGAWLNLVIFDHFGLGVLLLGAIWSKWSKMVILVILGDQAKIGHF